MFSQRNLVIVILACLAFVWGSAIMKYNLDADHTGESRTYTLIPWAQAPTIDTSFFDHGSETHTTSPSKPVVVPAKPRGLPGVTARAYIAGEPKTGRVYLELNSADVLPVASMSKLVTAFVATDLIEASTTITITAEALKAPPDRSNLTEHESFELSEALWPLLLSSSNITAEAVAQSFGRQKFMDLMKSYAWEVGMPHSYFADPSGVSPENQASANDLFGLARYLLTYRPDILAITRMGTTTVATTTDHGAHTFVSTHPFVNDTRFVGGKTGRTPEAGETMLTIMHVDSKDVAIVVLGSDNGARENDTRLILNKAIEIMRK